MKKEIIVGIGMFVVTTATVALANISYKKGYENGFSNGECLGVMESLDKLMDSITKNME